MARPEERWPTIISGYECDESRSEVRHICEPGRAERLFTILDLGIGGRIGPNSHLNLARGGHIGPNSHGSGYQFKHQASSDSGGGGGGIGAKDHCVHKEVCTSSHQPLGRRSLEEEMKPPRRNKPHKSPEPKPLPIDPIPFNFAEHGARYKRSYHDNCQEDTHYVLFILDTSASIGSSNFSRMTATLSRLVHQFCKPVKVAAMTFSDELYVEFCFNCFDNTCEGRRLLRDAMCNVPYRGGLTYTGAATRCACNTILTHECGFLDSDASGYRCLDIVYITDGQSNGPLDVCKEVDCFYNLPNVHIEVIAIGITNYDEDEINCIGMPPGEDSATAADRLFQFSDFDDFNNVIAHAEEYLFEISPLQCFSVPDGFSISEPCVSDDVC
jgi:hypothetical protein